MKPTKYSIPPQSNTRARVRIASCLWLGILHCLALVIWHQSTEPKALSSSLSGPAWVRDIEPFQGVLPGNGHVITATFQHSCGDVIDLVWSDDESRNLESVGTTSNHPFYSFDRGDYVQAESLQEGERLLTYSGDTKRVVSKLARPGPKTVYNLEVFGEHVYFIGNNGVLVHNSDSYGLNAGVPRGADVGTTFGEARPRGLAHSPLREGEIDQYRYFSNRPDDGLEGHEVWQNASTSAYGIGGRTGAIGGRNPSIAIATQNHRQIVNKLQREMIPDAASMPALDNIKANMSVLREAQRRGVGITDRQINDAGRKAVRFYMKLLKEGAIREKD